MMLLTSFLNLFTSSVAMFDDINSMNSLFHQLEVYFHLYYQSAISTNFEIFNREFLRGLLVV